jgi:hypothetical protein
LDEVDLAGRFRDNKVCPQSVHVHVRRRFFY